MADAGLLSIGKSINGRLRYQRGSFKHLEIPLYPRHKWSMSMPNRVKTRKAVSLAHVQSGMYLKVLHERATIPKVSRLQQVRQGHSAC